MKEADYPQILDEIRSKIGSPTDVLHSCFGVTVRRGMCCCPFHADKTPSMKIYESRVYCYGCGWHGDTIDLYAAAHGISLKEVIRQFRTDNNSEQWQRQVSTARRMTIIETAVKEDAEECYGYLCKEIRLQEWILRLYTPAAMDHEESRQIIEQCVKRRDTIEHILPNFYAGSRTQDLHGLRAAKGAGLWD